LVVKGINSEGRKKMMRERVEKSMEDMGLKISLIIGVWIISGILIGIEIMVGGWACR
jgi:hypothetical protein